MAGDVALREVARILRRSVKRHDLVARYGGEEFCLILYDVCKQDALGVAERVREEIQKIEFPNEDLLPAGDFTISAGVAEYPTDAGSSNDLIESADRALYSAKSRGRNRICSHIGDRRLAPRFPILANIHFSPLAHETVWSEALLQNISQEGLSLRMMHQTENDRLLRLKLPTISGRSCPELIGRVIWSRQHLDDTTFSGIKFVRMQDSTIAELKDYIHSALQSHI